MARIQVVDDEHAICWSLSRLGDLMGHEVQASSSAEEGLQLAERYLPELVILDLRLPGINGIEALRLLRKQFSDLPAIIISAFGDRKLLETIEQIGSASFLRKPFSLEEARAAINHILEAARCCL